MSLLNLLLSGANGGSSDITINGNAGNAVAAGVGGSVTLVTTQTIAVTNANLFFSPYNVYSDGGGAMAATNIKASSTYALMLTPGAYLKLRVTVASGGAGRVAITLDTTALNGLTASTCPTVSYGYNKRPFTSSLLAYSASAVTLVLATGLAAGTYSFEVRFKSVGTTALGAADRWATPKYAVKITGIEIDGSASIPTQTLRSGRLVAFGASLTEGVNILLPNNDSANDIKNEMNDATLAYASYIAAGMSAEYGIIAYGGQGFARGIGNQVASSTYPSFYNATDASEAWDKYYSGQARDLTSPVAPGVILIDQGYNDTGSLPSATVTSVLNAIRTAVGTTAWIFVVGQNCDDEANIVTGTANVASPARTKYIAITDMVTEGTTSEYSGDAAFGGTHFNERGSGLRAAEVLRAAQAYISATTTYSRARTVNATS